MSITALCAKGKHGSDALNGCGGTVRMGNAGHESCACPCHQPYRVDVQENGHSNWIHNELRYATISDASDAGKELMSRWFGIQNFRIVVVETEEVVG